ncbi:unnamed protein product [Merluccius merluccius]
MTDGYTSTGRDTSATPVHQKGSHQELAFDESWPDKGFYRNRLASMLLPGTSLSFGPEVANPASTKRFTAPLEEEEVLSLPVSPDRGNEEPRRQQTYVVEVSPRPSPPPDPPIPPPQWVEEEEEEEKNNKAGRRGGGGGGGSSYTAGMNAAPNMMKPKEEEEEAALKVKEVWRPTGVGPSAIAGPGDGVRGVRAAPGQKL